MIGLFLVFREFARAIRYAMRAPEAHALLLTTTVVIAGGSLFYMLVEGWSVLDALYFSVVTLATIGYGDLTPTTDIAKLFTIFYVLIGIGLVASTVGAFVVTVVLRAGGVVDRGYELGDRGLTSFISNPDAFSVIVALAAGVVACSRSPRTGRARWWGCWSR